MSKKTIAVLFGGRSNEHEVSIMSAMNVISAMSPDKYFILPVYITKDGRWFLYDGAIESIRSALWDKVGIPCCLSPDSSHKGLLRIASGKVKTIGVDAVFPVLHGKNGEDGTLQGLCELAGIPVVGCGMLSSAIAMDKAFTNIVAKANGIAHTPYVVGHIYEKRADITKRARKLGYPVFVKPASGGSSVGVSKASDKDGLLSAIEAAFAADSKILIEKAVIGRELECGVLGYADAAASPVGEIIAGAEFYDYDAKYNNPESKTVVPADIPEETAKSIQMLAVKMFKAIGAKGMARADFFLEEGTGSILFNEINTIPGFTAISLYPTLWAHAGIPASELCDRLIGIALGETSQNG